MTLATRLWTALKRALYPSRKWNSSQAWTLRPLELAQKSPEEWVRRGQAAQELLRNPLLLEAFQAVRSDLNAQLMAVNLADVVAHTRLVTAMQVTRAVERHLLDIIETGAAAVEQINLRGQRID